MFLDAPTFHAELIGFLPKLLPVINLFYCSFKNDLVSRHSKKHSNYVFLREQSFTYLFPYVSVYLNLCF